MIWLAKFLGVALAAALTDVCWAKYTIHTAALRAMPAAIWGSAIVAFGSVSVFGLLDDHRFVLASILGAFVGTYAAVARA